MRKTAIILGILLLLITGGYWLFKQFGDDIKDEVTEQVAEDYAIRRMVITDMRIAGPEVTLSGRIELSNPLPKAGSVDIGNIHTVTRLERRVTLATVVKPELGSASIPFSTRFKAGDLLATVRRLQNKDSLEGTFSTEIPIDVPVLGKRTISLKQQAFKLENLKLPKVEMGKPEITRIRLKEVGVEVPVHYQSIDDYGLTIRSNKAHITIDGLGEMEMAQGKPLVLPPHASRTVPMYSTLHIDKPLRTLGQVITDKDTYTAHIKSHIDLDLDTKHGHIDLPIDLTDTQKLELYPDKEGREKRKQTLEAMDRGK